MPFSEPVSVDESQIDWRDYPNHFVVAKALRADEHVDEETGEAKPVTVVDVWVFDKHYELAASQSEKYVWAKTLRRYFEPNIAQRDPCAYRLNTKGKGYKLEALTPDESERLLKAYNDALGLAPF